MAVSERCNGFARSGEGKILNALHGFDYLLRTIRENQKKTVVEVDRSRPNCTAGS